MYTSEELFQKITTDSQARSTAASACTAGYLNPHRIRNLCAGFTNQTLTPKILHELNALLWNWHLKKKSVLQSYMLIDNKHKAAVHEFINSLEEVQPAPAPAPKPEKVLSRTAAIADELFFTFIKFPNISKTLSEIKNISAIKARNKLRAEYEAQVHPPARVKEWRSTPVMNLLLEKLKDWEERTKEKTVTPSYFADKNIWSSSKDDRLDAYRFFTEQYMQVPTLEPYQSEIIKRIKTMTAPRSIHIPVRAGKSILAKTIRQEIATMHNNEPCNAKPMSSDATTLFSTRHYLDGRDMRSMNDEEVLAHIARMEDRANTLSQIDAPSKKRDKLVKRLEKDIKKITKLLDER